MAPPKKTQNTTSKKLKKKKKKKLKNKTKTKSLSSVPVDPNAIDSDWWDTFWPKNSSPSDASIPADEEEAFKYFFRVSKQTFEYICSLVREDLISRPPSGLINIEGRLLSVEKQVAIAVRRLASGESQVSVGSAFGVGQSTVSQVTWRFIEALEERGRHHLKWPDSSRIEEIKFQFESLFGLPNCCGAIDATHIVMTLPAVETSDDWCDQENNYSMFLQGVVDHEMRFLDIVTGWPGGMTVSRLLKCSGFYKRCENGERLNGNLRELSQGAEIREYIVGGVGYPLLPWLITPDGSDEQSDAMSSFDTRHEMARLLAVNSFLQLKGSWRILNKVMWRPDKRKLPSIILVCCLLHNIMIDNGDQLHPDVALSGHHDSAGYGEQFCNQIDPLGRTLRENLAKYLHLTQEKSLS
ncbi:protein ANTAGONIST OF LIKE HETEROCHROMATIN PROTEIN 1 [Mercurialis annua]|uniref:protein ANTAGONIST OF LIKE HETEROCHROMATIN PROTEIN 1 n=1 Tax=Mercurialis annua TaxID=3986 RepID=UPI00215FF06C|nr:protein ANTAGONIST OF LIKE HETEROCHROMATIN PROTEIN 1 [Mercurialis annua]